ncbi:MAG: hypothetical protein ACJ764_09325 [Solirubrobacteraceae bacterium]
MAFDPFLPFLVCPAEGEECFVVRGRQVRGQVEISLSRDLREGHRFGSFTYTPVELLAIKRFDHVDSAHYMAYANALEDAMRYAARGELGYTVDTVVDGGSVRVFLVARLLADDGRIRTEVSHEQRFEDADSHAALVQASETATELRSLAQALNDHWNSVHEGRLLQIQAEYEKSDADAAGARELDSILDSEKD